MKKKILKTLLITLMGLLVVSGTKAQFYSVRTNLVGLATLNLNVEGSMTLNRNWTVHLPVQYNPWTFSDNKKFQNLTVTPGVRYWFLESYARGFIGAHAVASRFHAGGWFGHKYRYDGQAYGLGISAGFAKVLSPHFNLEYEIGIGGVWADYDQYECRHCGRLKSSKKGIYPTVTKIAVNLVYLF